MLLSLLLMLMVMKKKMRSTSRRRKKKRTPFFPKSSSCVGSPTNGAQINRRTVRELSPQKLCSLALPSPLLSLFDADGSISARGGDEQSSIGNHRGRHPSSASLLSAGSTGTQHHNTRLPSHIRVGFAKCDPLIVFDGKYVLVGTADGRIAIYSILEFDRDISQDVKMSEIRRQREWEQEDSIASHQNTKEEKKVGDDNNKFSSELAEEDNEWEIRERMNRRERARLIDPLLVVTLPNRDKSTSLVGAEEDQGSASVFSPSTIIAMCATPKMGTSLVGQRNNTTNSTISTFGGGFQGHVAVLTDNGQVHVLEFSCPGTPKQIPESIDEAGSSNAATTPVVNIILSFDTENSGVTSICMRPAEGPALRLCVGSESGLLTEFQLHSTSHHHSRTISTPEHLPTVLSQQHSDELKTPMRPDMNPLQRQLSEPGSSPPNTFQPIAGPSDTVKVTLCWQGLSDAPIRSLSCPGWGGAQSFIAVGTEQRQYANAMRDCGSSLPNQELSPAISLDMINASLVESMWRKRSNKGDPIRNKTNDKSIPLSDCSVWPAAGMELKDGWLRSTTKRKPDVKQQLVNAADLQRVSSTSKLCCFEESQCFASAASDGTVAISHCLEEGSWGITDENNQIMLFQKCIGLGTIKSGNERYLACCLRGGTIYLVPVVVEGTDRKDIIMYATPVDSADSGAVRYVHNFTAGVAQVKSWQDKRDKDGSSSMKCVAMIGWSGGKIDVYEMNTVNTRCNLMLDKLTERGTLTKFVEMIRNMDETHHQLQSSLLWKQAWDECMKTNEVEAVVRNLNDGAFEGTRLLILSLTNGA